MVSLRNLTRASGVFILCFLILGAVAKNARAQNPRVLTLEESIAIALEKSYDMNVLEEDVISAKENLKAAKNKFRTNASLSFQLPDFTERVTEIPVANQLPVFNTTGTLRFQSELNIEQPLPTNGSIALQSLIYRRNISTLLSEENDKIKQNGSYISLSLVFKQPLFTLNSLKLGLKRGELDFERATHGIDRARAELVYSVNSEFYNLYKATRSAEIASEQVKQRQESYDIALSKYKSGLIAEVEALQLEVDLADSKNNLTVAKGSLERQKDDFKQLIGLNLDEDIAVSTAVEYKPINVDLDRAVAEALKNRPEIRERQIYYELAELNVKEVDSRSEIRGDLYAFYDLTGVSDANLPEDATIQDLFQSSWDNIKRRPRNRGVSFNVTVPLWDWGVNKAEVASAKANLRRTKLNLEETEKTIRREIRALVGRINEAQERVQILEKSREVARKSYQISLARFENGDITSQDLALVQGRLTSAEMAYLEAFIAYKLTLADLKRKTLWDFEKGRSAEDE